MYGCVLRRLAQHIPADFKMSCLTSDVALREKIQIRNKFDLSWKKYGTQKLFHFIEVLQTSIIAIRNSYL